MPLRHRIARACLTFSVFVLVLSWFMLCYCPGWFLALGILGAPAVGFGSPKQRVLGIALCLYAMIAGVLDYRQEMQMKAQAMETKARAAN